MTVNTVPLLDYWNAKAYPEGVPGMNHPMPPYGNPEAVKLWEVDHKRRQTEHDRRERRAWAEVCSEAATGKITIMAFRYVDRPEPRSWYPPLPASSLREEIPRSFFLAPNIYIGPMNPVVIYYTDRSAGGVFNAPWADPLVLVDRKVPNQRRGARPKADWPYYQQQFNERVATVGYPSEQNEFGWQRPGDVTEWLNGLLDADGVEISPKRVEEYTRRFMAAAKPS